MIQRVVWLIVVLIGLGLPGVVSSAQQAETRTVDSAGAKAESKIESAEPKIDLMSWTAEVRDHNLWLVPKQKSSAPAVPLTTDASESFTFQDLGRGASWNRSTERRRNRGDLHWHPRHEFLVAMQVKRSTGSRLRFIESAPQDRLQPTSHEYLYTKPGDPIPAKRLRLFSVRDQREIPVSDELFPTPYQTRFLGWSKSAETFWLLYNQRGHQVLRLLEVSVADGTVRTIVEEKSNTFIHYSDRGKLVHQRLPNSELLWASERSGWNHLYRYRVGTAGGELINAVTQGPWNVKRIHRIDQQNDVIYFFAVGLAKGQDPYHEHFCRVNFDGSGMIQLTDGDGTHEIKESEDGTSFVDTYSRVDLAPVTEKRSLETGELLEAISAKQAKSVFGKRRLTERFVAKGRDGKTDIWGIIHWPRDFDPEKTYPVIENIYAGPHDHHVPKKFRTRYYHQHQIADAGFIVVQIDGMGTAWRSKSFHDVCYKNLRDSGFPDRMAWIKAAAKKHPQMDLSRVGIYGGSAGGQSAMAALLWHHDFYHVAVADCGCHDNRMDKIWWNEQWMGWPVDQSYFENSNMENAQLLQGKLMLTLGEMDRNVDPSSTVQVVGRLIKHNKDFEFVLLPGQGHGAGEGRWAARQRIRFFKQHLESAESPQATTDGE